MVEKGVCVREEERVSLKDEKMCVSMFARFVCVSWFE